MKPAQFTTQSVFISPFDVNTPATSLNPKMLSLIKILCTLQLPIICNRKENINIHLSQNKQFLQKNYASIH